MVPAIGEPADAAPAPTPLAVPVPVPVAASGTQPDHLDAVVVRLRAAGCVFAEDEATLLLEAATGADGVPDLPELERLVERRVEGLPLEHLLGWAQFSGLRVGVAAGVFVPRRRTELLVREALALLPGPGGMPARDGGGPVVVDLCCGSGAIGLAVVTARPDVRLVAADVDDAAVACARRNLAPHGVLVLQGDLDAPLPADLRGRVDVLTANTPYVPTGAVALMPPEARLHEHAVALDGGPDGLDLQRRLAAVAARWLAPGGHVLVETSERQAPAAVAVMAEHGLHARVVSDDDLDATVVVGTRAPTPGRPRSDLGGDGTRRD
ncbi:methylase [Cellulomonas soli]|uniref:peptide chain release factor N(5)-glutamine methyltransferase n=1 Tax=Cellulomonas soli TaxID=931535 RepID=A0A512PES4_9CELL|nr:release factor glutamine methyltransferase [Cellulomonas soli]GEP69705.1 methylase [Cellulomonas soli]